MTLEILTYILIGLVLILIVFVLIILSGNKGLKYQVKDLTKDYQTLLGDVEATRNVNNGLTDSIVTMTKLISENQKSQAEAIDRHLSSQKEGMNEQLELMSRRLEKMYEDLGEMKTLKTGVDDLKKVLSNVKTRGILGEVQLGAILEQILSKEQYGCNIETVPGTNRRVEYAVKFPGEGENPVWLPIDSKFPGDSYNRYRDAYDTGNPELINIEWKELEKRLKSEAKDIKDKYIASPYTTDFGIMFLPFEGLYSEAVSHGLVEVLQRDYKVVISGPTTMAVLLNSFQMGFRTLAIEKHSSEVWDLLGAIKNEFSNYISSLEEAEKAIRLAEKKLDYVLTTRTKAVDRKLRSVEALGKKETEDILEIEGYLEDE